MAHLPDKYDPKIKEKAIRLMEWCALIVIATASFGITFWFTGRYIAFYLVTPICLLMSIIFLLGPVFIGLPAYQGKMLNCILFAVIGILITHKFLAGILLGGCFYGLCGMVPMAWALHLERKRKSKEEERKEEEDDAITGDERDTRINRMSEAFDYLSDLSASLTESTEDLENAASDVDLLKDYVASGKWMADFEDDERGEIGPEVNRSVLSEDGLYNLMSDLDDLMHAFERLQERFAADPELEKKLQED